MIHPPFWRRVDLVIEYARARFLPSVVSVGNLYLPDWCLRFVFHAALLVLERHEYVAESVPEFNRLRHKRLWHVRESHEVAFSLRLDT